MSHPLKMKSLSKRSLSPLSERLGKPKKKKTRDLHVDKGEIKSDESQPEEKADEMPGIKKRYTICKTSAVYIKLSSFEITSAQRKTTREDVKEDYLKYSRKVSLARISLSDIV